MWIIPGAIRQDTIKLWDAPEFWWALERSVKIYPGFHVGMVHSMGQLINTKGMRLKFKAWTRTLSQQGQCDVYIIVL